MKINGNLVFNGNATGEIQNAYIERLAAAPVFNAAHKGRLYFNTTTALFYYNDGSAWVPFATGGNAAALQAEVDALEASIGAAVNGDGTFNDNGFSGAQYITSPTSVTDAIMQLDSALNANNTLAELDDVQLGALNNKDILYYNAGATSWVNGQPGSSSGVQGYDAGLKSFADLTGPGFVTIDASGDVVAARTFTMPAEGLTMTNTNGGGNPVVALANDLAAVEGLTGTGIAVRTATDAWTNRSIVGGLTGTIVVTDGDGVAGNPTLNLETLTIPTNAGNFLKFSYDTFGRVTAVNPVTQGDITALIDTVYVNAAGDTMSGNLNMGGNTVTGLGAPTAGSDAATKNYVDALTAGLSWKQAVKAASTGNIDLATGGLLTVDDIALVAGDRVLVKDQTVAAQNGIYVAAAGAWVRAADADVAGELDGLTVFVQQGTVNADTGWTQTADSITLGTTAITFVQFTGAGTYSAGVGLALTGNTFSVNLGAGIVELPSDEVGLDLYSINSSALILTEDGFTRSTSGDAKLALLLHTDGSGSLTQGTGGLKIAANGVSEAEIDSSTLAADGGLTGGSGTKLAVNVDGDTLTIGSNVVSVADAGISTVKIQDGAVTNAKLQYSYITVIGSGVGAGTTDVNLGDTLQFAGINGITTKVNNDGTVEVELVAGLDELADVEVSAPAAGDTLVYVSGDSTFQNRKIYHVYESPSAATSHTVNHDIGQKYCNVTVVDDTDEVVIPQSITFGGPNTLTVTFTSAIDCKVIVMGVNAA